MGIVAGVITTVLWDCDGVLQHSPHDWAEALERIGGGPQFATALFEAEKTALRGERSLRDVVDELLQQRPTGASTQDVLALWAMFVEDEDAWEVVDAVRAAGVRCVLATNQQDHRVQHMREVRGYDDLVDGSYYSSEIGAMKPDRVFFERVLDDLGLSGDRVGFVDDVPANVEAARSVGIRAVLHDPESGAEGLVADLTPLVPELADLGARA